MLAKIGPSVAPKRDHLRLCAQPEFWRLALRGIPILDKRRAAFLFKKRTIMIFRRLSLTCLLGLSALPQEAYYRKAPLEAFKTGGTVTAVIFLTRLSASLTVTENHQASARTVCLHTVPRGHVALGGNGNGRTKPVCFPDFTAVCTGRRT